MVYSLKLKSIIIVLIWHADAQPLFKALSCFNNNLVPISSITVATGIILNSYLIPSIYSQYLLYRKYITNDLTPHERKAIEQVLQEMGLNQQDINTITLFTCPSPNADNALALTPYSIAVGTYFLRPYPKSKLLRPTVGHEIMHILGKDHLRVALFCCIVPYIIKAVAALECYGVAQCKNAYIIDINNKLAHCFFIHAGLCLYLLAAYSRRIEHQADKGAYQKLHCASDDIGIFERYYVEELAYQAYYSMHTKPWQQKIADLIDRVFPTHPSYLERLWYARKISTLQRDT